MSSYIIQFIDAMAKDGVFPKNQSDIKDTGGQSVLIKEQDGGKSLYYSFHDEGSKANGHWYSCKLGHGGRWFSRAGKDWSAEDRAAYKEEIARSRAAEQEAREKEYSDKAIEALSIWKSANKLGDSDSHPYLAKKMILANGARIDQESRLVIPGCDAGGKIWTVQTISESGEKSFLYRGKKKGCFFPIGWSPTKDFPDKIIICEGYATGCSIYEALAVPVACAFDSGNLLPVGLGIREKYKSGKIIYAADNDLWTFKSPRAKEVLDINRHDIGGDDERWHYWRSKGYLENVGFEAAKAASVSGVGAKVVYPEFADKKKKLTDFNDVRVHYGYDAIRDTFARVLADIESEPARIAASVDISPDMSVQLAGGDYSEDVDFDPSLFNGLVADEIIDPESTPPVPAPAKKADVHEIPNGFFTDQGNDFFNRVIWKKQGVLPEPKSLHNRILYLRAYFGDHVVYNEFSDQIVLVKEFFWEKKLREMRNRGRANKVEWRSAEVTEVDLINLCSKFEQLWGFVPSVQQMGQAVEAVARENRINPAQEYFKRLKWDGVPRLGTWLTTYLGAVDQNPQYLDRIGTMWLVAGAARILKPATKYDHMLVLEGKMNIGKSSALRELATFGGESFFCDSVTLNMLNNPKACQILQGHVIVEFAELDGIDKIGELTLRGWITRQEDKILKNYAKAVSYFPRQFILAATTNEDKWLKDVLGSRRYHPVRVTNVDMPALKRDKDQLWAEAIHLYNDGYKIYLSDDDPVYAMALAEQTGRFEEDPYEVLFDEYLNGKTHTTLPDMWRGCGLNINNLDDVATARMRKYLRRKGWESQTKRIAGKPQRVYCPEDRKIIINVREEVQVEEIPVC